MNVKLDFIDTIDRPREYAFFSRYTEHALKLTMHR